MTWVEWLLVAVLVLGVITLFMRTRRLLNLSRRQQKNIDYSKIKRWDEEDEEDEWR